MLEEFIEKIKNNDKVVFLPKVDTDYLDSFKYIYGDCVVLVDDSITEYSEISNIINENDKIKEVYFVNFMNLYRRLMPEINKKLKINEIVLCNVANLTSNFILPIFYDITEFYERKIINKIYALDEGIYEILKKANYNIERFKIKLPFNEKNINLKNKNSKSIGILSIDYDPVHNFYNMLTSISLINNYDKVKLISHMNATNDFFDYFDIKHEFCKNLDDVMKDNFINLYCNFTNTNPCIVLKSMDMGIPCIVGNTDMFNNNKTLKELLVLKSDDDVNEISEKIDNIKDNYDRIFKEYKKWRKNYEK